MRISDWSSDVCSSDLISLRVRPEVSELSTEGAIEMQGFQVPALTIRRAETTVELGSGESFMIAGLLNNRSIGAIDKMPGLGDVPLLGTLFKSDSFLRGETRSEEHTSELQSLMRIPYAVFCLK